MSLGVVREATNALQINIQREMVKAEPQVGYVIGFAQQTREILAETFHTKHEVIQDLYKRFRVYLDENEDTKNWYEIWKSGNSDQLWKNVATGVVKNVGFAGKTSKLNPEERIHLIRSLSWLSVADEFVSEHLHDINSSPVQGNDLVVEEVVDLSEFKKQSVFYRNDDDKTIGEQEQPVENNAKTRYDNTVRGATEKFWDELVNVSMSVKVALQNGHYVEASKIIASDPKLVKIASVFATPTHSAADVLITFAGLSEMTEGIRNKNKALTFKGGLKVALGLIPFPTSWLAPGLDKLIKTK